MIGQRLDAPVVPPAPLDAGELARALQPFGSSRMLPKPAYLADDVLAWERTHLFSRWRCLGRTSELVGAAGLRAVSLDDGGVLLARDREGIVRAFENACRHRGHELLACGTSADPRAIVCPYHAWTYDFDGSLLVAPGFTSANDFDPSNFGLNAIPIADWHGWLFVDASGCGGEFGDHIGELENIVAPYGAESLVTAATHEYDVEANWKVIVENFQECYHCPMIHPELCRVSPPDSGVNLEQSGDWIGGWMQLRPDAQTMSLDGHSGGAVIARLDEVQRRTIMYVAVLPNLLVSLHPDYVMTHLLVPLTPDRTHIQCSWAFPRETVASDGFDPSYAVDFWDLTNRQDWSACESVQRGMKTPRFTPGPLAPAEDGVYQFVTYLARAYQGS